MKYPTCIPASRPLSVHLTKMLLQLLSLVLLQPLIFGHEPFTDEHQLMEELLQESIMACPPTDFYNPCSYEDDCKVYGDCCSETALTFLQNSNNTLDPLPPSLNRWKCRRFPTEWIGYNYIFMVSSCPTEWLDTEVLLRCTKSVQPKLYTHILDVPVLSENTNVIYANIYCAVCNDDSSDIAPTQMTVWCHKREPLCSFLIQNAQYEPGMLQWIAGSGYINAYINEYPSSRQCIEYVDYCATQNSSLETIEENVYRKLCYLHSYPIRISSKFNPDFEVVYKNVHCAVCNGILPNVSSCNHIDHIIILSTPPPPPTFSLLIDFHGSGSVGTSYACGVGRMYDAVTRTCIAYFCGKRYHMDKFGKCVPKTLSPYTAIPTDQSVNTKDGLNDSCAKILILQHQYTYMNSTTIRINRTNDENTFETQYFEETGNGSVLICTPDTVTLHTDKFSTVQGLLTTICLAFSLTCLAVHILVYLFVSKLRNLPGKNLLSLSCSIFVAQLLFISGVNLKEPHTACVAIGAMVHLFYLASFFWMNVMAFDMFRTFASKSLQQNDQHQQRCKFKRYSTYAWISPCLIVATALVLDATNVIPELKPQYAEPYCWINSRMALSAFLALPLLVLLVENIVFFTLIASAIRRTTAEAAIATRGSIESERTRFFLYLKLASIVGLTWVFGFIAALTDLEPFWYLNIILNSLQGAFIFFAFTFKRKILSAVIKLPKNYVTQPAQRTAEPETTAIF